MVHIVMSSLLIIGAGGYGQLVKEIAEDCGYVRVDFIDDEYPDAVGKVSELASIQKSYDGCMVAIGNPDIRNRISEKCEKLVTIIHQKATVSRLSEIKNGCVIEANAVINANSRIGKGTFVCAGVVVNHNAVIGEYCQIDCNAVVASRAVVPEKTKVKSCTVWDKY